jgi:hypothetical protein
VMTGMSDARAPRTKACVIEKFPLGTVNRVRQS